MAVVDTIIAPVAGLLDKLIPDPRAREAAQRELLRMEGTQELERVKTQIAAILAEAQASDPWTSRARPGFLYVMYALLLWSIPMGLIAAVRPQAAAAIAQAMNGYLAGLPEPLYTLFATGYLGYTVAREWGKARAK
ncbi:hypothetical protein GCM10022253_02530 [Sphingomonas endophytica]|uniref:Holin of 3TMs, for gene-transfer release n=1 Tax=Sphingomonas endophytica TaxID=869719 RepID=A0A7X0JDH1_9SPHN|nr:3TM-type holin [Sphingomonas endophytica]MBB5725405.1 hypothetical protein [Sphingomonas endophytica]MBB6505555.1 hypothetical protein [Sphingomonas endophytica]